MSGEKISLTNSCDQRLDKAERSPQIFDKKIVLALARCFVRLTQER